ncbi:MAG: dihydroneopterin aldolase [Kiritimatiellia bacterium]
MSADLQSDDQLELGGLKVSCIIGDLPDERIKEQTLRIDAVLFLSLRQAAQSDDLRDTVDYAELCNDIRSVLKRAQCRMLERAADCVASVCLSDVRVRKVRVRVEKRNSVEGLDAAAVVIERSEKNNEYEIS